MEACVSAPAHLIGAFGLHWRKDEISWHAPRGETWQMLGHHGSNLPGLRVCDFRRARGIYSLHDEYGVSYVGLARGDDGIGTRLRRHVDDQKKDWSRFSWFAFDDVTSGSPQTGWSEVVRRDETKVNDITADISVGEFEALLIQVLGTAHRKHQSHMQFKNSERWEQVTWAKKSVLERVDPTLLLDSEWRNLLSGD